MKNWLPSLVKNLEPTAEMVGMALTVAQIAANTRRTKAGREPMVRQDPLSPDRYLVLRDSIKRSINVELILKVSENENSTFW